MFDPYRKWLGILPKDQPPNHYRLLGVELFESDLDVIEGAAERQMAFVRQYQSGEYAAEAARILSELALARLCLLKPKSKADYDAKLRKQLSPTPEPEPVEVPEAPTDGQEWETLLSRKRNQPRQSEIFGIPTKTLLIGIAVAIVLGLLLSLMRPRAWVNNHSVQAIDPPSATVNHTPSITQRRYQLQIISLSNPPGQFPRRRRKRILQIRQPGPSQDRSSTPSGQRLIFVCKARL